MPFTGRAIYDNGVMDGVAEDVSPIITMISPYETPLLSALGDAQKAATSVQHEWLEDALAPNTISNSSVIGNTLTDTPVGVAGGLAKFLQVGTILRMPESVGAEYAQISAIAGNTITITRAFAGTSVTTAVNAGESISVISDAALDGADVVGDISRPRVRKSNYTHIFKKDVIVSGTVRAVTMLGGISDEWDHQVQQRLREQIRDLEKAVILSRLSGNTIGSASAVRTMAGMLQQLTRINTMTTMTPANLTATIKMAWDEGGTDVDLVVCGDAVKRAIDDFNQTRQITIQGQPAELVHRNLVSVFECTYGSVPIMMTRWMPPKRFAVISRARVQVTPLQGRSFQFQEVAKSGDSTKGFVLGEYTLECRNVEGMVQGLVTT